jgi:cytochrome c-type biogenesis protein CcmH
MIAAAAFLVLAGVTPLADPAQERRAQDLEREIRCVVCENEPISQSTSDMAADMRKAVRDQIAAGKTDPEVRDFFAERYGEFVLFNPRPGPLTWALWAAPALMLLFGLFALLRLRAPAGPTLEPEQGEDR